MKIVIYLILIILSLVSSLVLFNFMLYWWVDIKIIVNLTISVIFFWFFTYKLLLKVKNKNTFYISFLSIFIIIWLYSYNYSNINFDKKIYQDNDITIKSSTINENSWFSSFADFLKNNLNNSFINLVKKCKKESCDLSDLENFSEISNYFQSKNSNISSILKKDFSFTNEENFNWASNYIKASNFFANQIRESNKELSKSILENNYNLSLNFLNSISSVWNKYLALYFYKDTIIYLTNKSLQKEDFINIMNNVAIYEYKIAETYILENPQLINNIFFNKTQFLEYKKYKLFLISNNFNKSWIQDINYPLNYYLLNRKYIYDKTWWDLNFIKLFKDELLIHIK